MAAERLDQAKANLAEVTNMLQSSSTNSSLAEDLRVLKVKLQLEFSYPGTACTRCFSLTDDGNYHKLLYAVVPGLV